MKLSKSQRKLEKKFLSLCKEHSGPAISGWNLMVKAHGATTYRTDFLINATKLFRIYKKKSLIPIYELSASFLENKILTCRGHTMTYEKTKYLCDTHLNRVLRELEKK